MILPKRNNFKLTNKSTNKFVLVLFVLSLIYVIVRSFSVSFTMDESISYSIFNDAPVFKNTANHHPLNTWWMQFSCYLFGQKEWAMRALNVFGFGLYIFAAYQLLQKIENKWMIIFGSILLVLNPYFIEFFSLARGYGIATGCIMMSIYYLFHSDFRSKNVYYTLLTICFAVLALIANFGSINFLFSLLPILIFRIVQSNEKIVTSFIYVTVVLAIVSICSWIVVQQLISLKENNELYHGANSFGFTINSVIQSWIYYPKPWVLGGIIFKYSMLIIISISAIYSLLQWKNRPLEFYLTILLAFIVTGYFIEHAFFNALFPSFRTTIFLFPITTLLVVYALNKLILNHAKITGLVFSITGIISITIILSFTVVANFNQTFDWKFDKHSREISMIIAHDKNYLTSEKTVGNHWLFEPTLNYYRVSRKLGFQKITRNQYTFTEKYIYDFRSNLSRIPKEYKILTEYKDIETILLVRKH